ncbi:hypothetical protein LUZ60_013828 [Juncus effusus]|nr:hypothetical protein LUZ60_013828 [Juncus effusus]
MNHGDWNCRSCQYLNFTRREMCQRCSDPRPPSAFIPGAGSGRSTVVLRGDWYCTCGYHNFASRTNCLKCTASKNTSAGEADVPRGPRAFLPGDWTCTRPGCEEHNFASRTECRKCGSSRVSLSVKEN